MIAKRLLAITSVLLFLLACANEQAPWVTADEGVDGSPLTTTTKPLLRREGSQLQDEAGRFITSGNRLTFIAATGAHFVGLENLNLERVGKIVTASPDSVEWFVTGSVTEYQGSNYLLISRARRKPSAPQGPRGF
jgi:hypothetical protein